MSGGEVDNDVENDFSKTLRSARPCEMLARRATEQVVEASKMSSRMDESVGVLYVAITNGKVLALREWIDKRRKRSTERREGVRCPCWWAI